MSSARTVATRATALPPEQRRARIVEATLPLLADHGEMITTRQIAEAAGVAEGTIFRVFADKDELLAATLEAALDQAPLEEALAAIDRTTDLEQQLVVAVEVIGRRIDNLWSLVSNLGPKLQSQAARPLADSDALTDLLASHQAQLRIDPPAAARLLRALTLSMTHPMLAGERATASEIAAFFLHGVQVPPNHGSRRQ